ncbi:hypothetical protein CDD82_268 [Ophiocordyceps australis]|uniref:C2H2-type domain-containing protein n=1 Tax=Ophiocordyceps australis TaxID=1399860 RepID=A0A2C5YMG3_9HYPO|nr:hypothetical protein CDD82_268 [Ophiocordyceps australis]
MATVARPPQQEPRQHDCRLQTVADTFDPDDVLTTHDSPPMQVLRPRLEPSPSPPPDIPPAHIRPSSGDAVLVSYLDNGRCPDIARTAGVRALADDHDKLNNLHHDHELQHLAADALQAVSADISASTRQLSIAENACCLSRQQHPAQIAYNTTARSAARQLPPLQMASPKSEANSGRSLPSIRSTLGDITCIVPSEPPTPADHDSATSRLPPLSATHMSPPISPSEAYQRSLPSPHSLPASSPYNYYSSTAAAAVAVSSSSSSFKQRSALMDYSTNPASETPATDHSDSTTPATTTSVADRMSINGITHPQVGVYVCNFLGCTALPFQTQYLLNSHANVHSSARPHYCPVKDCPRSEGGKGFKRKNEMIRHGLVHDSPGYVCPFCPDREHKYPRPDNLQRHVRVHHLDKDKDDPLLRDVLSQRPDGPNRGRRRRAVITVS